MSASVNSPAASATSGTDFRPELRRSSISKFRSMVFCTTRTHTSQLEKQWPSPLSRANCESSAAPISPPVPLSLVLMIMRFFCYKICAGGRVWGVGVVPAKGPRASERYGVGSVDVCVLQCERRMMHCGIGVLQCGMIVRVRRGMVRCNVNDAAMRDAHADCAVQDKLCCIAGWNVAGANRRLCCASANVCIALQDGIVQCDVSRCMIMWTQGTKTFFEKSEKRC